MIASEHADIAPIAMVYSGLLLRNQDRGVAQANFQNAIDTGHAVAAPSGAIHSGALLEEQGYVPAARARLPEGPRLQRGRGERSSS